MTVVLKAPLPLLETTTILPNPQMNDGEAPRHVVKTSRAIDGTLYSYIKTSATNKLNYTFLLSRMKALELRAFITSYYRAKVQLTNHKSEVWEVYFLNNPFEFNASDGARNVPGGEQINVVLEMEGVKISG